MKTSDFLIIGSGIAGLSLALRLAEHGRVNLITKRDPSDSNTNKAQGGIAAVVDAQDSFELHIEDTLRAGDGLCRPQVVEFVVREGPDRIRDLIAMGLNDSTGPSKTRPAPISRVGHWRRRSWMPSPVTAISRCTGVTWRSI